MARNPLKAGKKRNLVETSPINNGSDMAGDPGVDDAYGSKKYAEILGVYDEGVPRILYQICVTEDRFL